MDSTNKDSKLELTAVDDQVASVFLSLTATDIDSIGDIGDVIMGVDNTVIVVFTVVSDRDPHFTLKFPFAAP